MQLQVISVYLVVMAEFWYFSSLSKQSTCMCTCMYVLYQFCLCNYVSSHDVIYNQVLLQCGSYGHSVFNLKISYNTSKFFLSTYARNAQHILYPAALSKSYLPSIYLMKHLKHVVSQNLPELQAVYFCVFTGKFILVPGLGLTLGQFLAQFHKLHHCVSAFLKYLT